MQVSVFLLVLCGAFADDGMAGAEELSDARQEILAVQTRIRDLSFKRDELKVLLEQKKQHQAALRQSLGEVTINADSSRNVTEMDATHELTNSTEGSIVCKDVYVQCSANKKGPRLTIHRSSSVGKRLIISTIVAAPLAKFWDMSCPYVSVSSKGSKETWTAKPWYGDDQAIDDKILNYDASSHKQDGAKYPTVAGYPKQALQDLEDSLDPNEIDVEGDDRANTSDWAVREACKVFAFGIPATYSFPGARLIADRGTKKWFFGDGTTDEFITFQSKKSLKTKSKAAPKKADIFKRRIPSAKARDIMATHCLQYHCNQYKKGKGEAFKIEEAKISTGWLW